MPSRAVIAGYCLGLSLACVARTAQADTPPPTYRWVAPSHLDLAETERSGSNVIFLNRCAGGCSLAPGGEDARIDRSSLLSRTVAISEFAHGQAAWDAVVSCVAGMYEPFGVVVTDVDPGSAPHFEAIVAGSPGEIGATGIGGVSPFACGVIENAITYSFANIYGSVQDICETVAQESAHAFGLEHEYLCADPMTYLTGCGSKSFQDVDAPCGERAPRDCECGGATQNSYQRLMEVFDPDRDDDHEPVEPDEVDPVDPGEVADSGCRVAGGGQGAGALLLVFCCLLLGRLRSKEAV